MAAKPGRRQGGEGHRYDAVTHIPSREARRDTDGVVSQVAGALEALGDSLNPGEADATITGFIARMAALEATTNHPEATSIFGEARAMAVTLLIGTGYMDQAIRVVAAITDVNALTGVMVGVETALFIRGDLATAAMFERRVFEALDRDSPALALDFLRQRRSMVIGAPQEGASDMLNQVNQQLADRIGSDFDPINDWAATEMATYPHADWHAIAAILHNESLWLTDMPLHERLSLCEGAGKMVNNILAGVEVSKWVARDIKAFTGKMVSVTADLPAVSYLNAMLTVALYSQGLEPHARVRLKTINVPEAVADVANGLLRMDEPMVREAQRIVLGLENRRLLMDTLLDAPWPDRAAISKIIDEIVTIGTNRTAGGSGPFVSLHPIPMRIECIRALADRREEEGNTEKAAELRRREKQLQWQLANGIVKHMPRGGKNK